MRKWRTVGVVLVTLATLALAYDDSLTPRPVRIGALVVIAIGGALGIPAHPAITRKAAVQDKQAS